MKLILLACSLVLAPSYGVESAVAPDAEIADYDRVKTIYAKLATAIPWDREQFSTAYSKLITSGDVSVYYLTSAGLPDRGKCYLVQSQLVLFIDASTFELRGLTNKPLENYLGEHPDLTQAPPSLSVDQAIEQANEYASKIGFAIPKSFHVRSVIFGESNPGRWEVRWTHYAGNYPFDDFVPPDTEYVSVVFHETLGLSSFGQFVLFPEPSTLEVKVSRDDAIQKAAKYAPLVLRTPFYQQGRASGFVVSEVKDAVLKVAVPNWLLNPDKAIWMREEPPKETRLCWVVTFGTLDKMAQERKTGDGKLLKLKRPEILIYLDASTGEVVGANFS